MNTSERVKFLVENLQLSPHPEGGFYKETYRSSQSKETPSGERNLLTSIFFLLTSENVSRFHRIKSDELWYFHEGSSLTVHLLNESGYRKLNLGNQMFNSHTLPFGTVKAGTIFGSTVDDPNSYALVSCAVAPGFDFRDFELFKTEELLRLFPTNEEIIHRLT
jgi:uncharacterized protein